MLIISRPQIGRRSVSNRRSRMRNTSGPTYTIPAGRRFEGRMSGGSYRAQIYGTRTYGSGYPGISGRGTSGRNFPFIFWPIAWPNVPAHGGNSSYLIDSAAEYGNTTNSTEIRPGGPLKVFTLSSKPLPTVNRFYLLGDEYTLAELDGMVSSDCSTYFDDIFNQDSSKFVSEFIEAPFPEQVVQYYRASSLALALEGYNNSATYAPEGSLDTKLPLWTNTQLLDCLNLTIGRGAPLRSAAMSNFPPSLWLIMWLFVILRCL